MRFPVFARVPLLASLPALMVTFQHVPDAQAQNSSPQNASAQSTPSVPKDRISLNDYLDWEDVAAPSLAPDGKSPDLHAHMDRQNQRQAGIILVVDEC